MLFAGTSQAAEVKVGADIELVYGQYTVDPAVGGADSNFAAFYTQNANIYVKMLVDENTEAMLKVDADDNADQLEEAWVKFGKLGGAPVALKLGKQEVPFGMDKNPGIMYPYTHNSGTGSLLNLKTASVDINQDGAINADDAVPHFGEVDNKFAFTFITDPIAELGTIELSVFQNSTAQGVGADADKPADNGATQSYAVRVTSKRIPGLDAEVSYINMHSEGMDGTPGETDDSSAISVGLDYTFKPVEVFAEYISGNNLDFVTDSDQTAIHGGVIYSATDKISVAAQYEQLAYDMDGSDSNPTATKLALTPKYVMDNGVELALEYVAETLDADEAGVEDIDASGIFARVKVSLK
jgi:hypothetical protein